MPESIFGVPLAAFVGQLLVGMINGSFYALMSLGLAIIFGLLHVVNFAHGAQYMLGAFVAWGLLEYAGLGYWWALLIAPVVVGGVGMVLAVPAGDADALTADLTAAGETVFSIGRVEAGVGRVEPADVHRPHLATLRAARCGTSARERPDALIGLPSRRRRSARGSARA
jgi:hypothetical protein